MIMKPVFARKSGSQSKFESGSVFAPGSESTRRSSRRLSESRGYTTRSYCTPMPSVGMRRTTRVFGVVKGLDGGARVLRSGRCLLREPGEGKIRKGKDNEDWFKLINSPGNGGIGCKQSGWGGLKRVTAVDIKDAEDCKTEVPRCGNHAANVNQSMDKLFGMVYSRKRKITSTENCDFSSCDFDRTCRLQFFRRHRRKVDGSGEFVASLPRPMLAVVGGSCCFVVSFLCSVLTYMRKARLCLNKLSAFLCSEPIATVYASCGIQFLRDPSICSGSGMCKFFGMKDFIPLFSVEFAIVPLCFMYMHHRMLLRFKCWPFVLVNNSSAVDTNGDITIDSEDEYEDRRLCIPLEKDLSVNITTGMDPSVCKNIVHEVNNMENRVLLHPSIRASKLPGRSAQYRNGLNSRSFQKRRSSPRQRRARNPAAIRVHKPHGVLVSDAINGRRNGIPLSSSVNSGKLRSSVQSSSVRQVKEVTCTLLKSRQDLEPSCCSANILEILSDKCYRHEGANIKLEVSASREWHLVVKKDGLTRYTQKPEKNMRPCSCNRFTHAIMWNLDNGWKLEFPNRLDWFIFKDLYNECLDRNMLAPTVKNIPVPGVVEVLDYENSSTIPFCRPDSYISIKDDEVSRAMARSTAIYEMDSEDEKWLEKFNNESFTENELHQRVSGDAFEFMVDALEKAYYCHPTDFSDEKAAAYRCLGRSEVVEGMCNYWMKKRKQKGSVLVRVFQSHQVKRAPVIPKPLLRRRRSLKRQPSQLRRGKPPSVFRAMVTERDTLEEKNATIKVKEANALANRSVEYAALKRKRTQFLMENADLATYKAMMALRIAEAARVAESPDATASYFLD
ncbi:hypothetical protein I3760_14G032500 [Carya illinoinensis]|nr:hypothetical protein I3760_14G032500 [Carya illinoinensis]